MPNDIQEILNIQVTGTVSRGDTWIGRDSHNYSVTNPLGFTFYRGGPADGDINAYADFYILGEY